MDEKQFVNKICRVLDHNKIFYKTEAVALNSNRRADIIIYIPKINEYIGIECKIFKHSKRGNDLGKAILQINKYKEDFFIEDYNEKYKIKDWFLAVYTKNGHISDTFLKGLLDRLDIGILLYRDWFKNIYINNYPNSKIIYIPSSKVQLKYKKLNLYFYHHYEYKLKKNESSIIL